MLNIFLNLQNVRQQILNLLAIADFSNGLEFIFKGVIGQYDLRTIFLHYHWIKTIYGYLKREKNSVLRTKIKISHIGYLD